MNRYSLGVLLASSINIFLFIGITTAQNSQNIHRIETNNGIENDDIYERDWYPSMIETLVDVCSAEELKSAENYTSGIIKNISNRYTNLPVHLQLTSSENLHTRLVDFHEGKLFDEDVSCELKLILYSVQSWLREYYVQTIVESGLIDDIDTKDGGDLHMKDIKYDMLDWQIQQLEKYEEAFEGEFQFRDGTQINLSRPDLIELAQKSKRIMELSVMKGFYELMQVGLLDESDIYILNEKITLHMNLSCSTLHGNYTITEKTDHNNNHVRFTTQEMPLGVNVCGNFFFLKELSNHFYKIVIHEMGHHFYYHHDLDGNTTFENICWAEISCVDSDFVSQYASTTSEEDYAEHFMKRFLGHIEKESPKIIEKSLYFEKFLK